MGWDASLRACLGPALFSTLGSVPAAPFLVQVLITQFRWEWLTAWGIAVIVQKCSLILCLLTWSCYWDHLSLRSIGLRLPDWPDLAAALFAFFAYEAIANFRHLIVLGPDLFVASSRVQTNAVILVSFTDMFSLSIGLRLCLAVVNGFEEELLFRGYTIERIGLVYNPVVGASIGIVLNLLSHAVYWDAVSALRIGLGQIAFAALYLRRRSLIACALAHSLSDGLTFLAWPLIR